MIIVPVVSDSDKTQLTNFSSHQHTQLLYLSIGNIRKDIPNTSNSPTWILIWLISCPHMVSKILKRSGILPFDFCCRQSRMLTALILARSGIELMDSRQNFILVWLSCPGIMQNKWWLCMSHVVHVKCEKWDSGHNWNWCSAHSGCLSNQQQVLITLSLQCSSTLAAWWIASTALGFS